MNEEIKYWEDLMLKGMDAVRAFLEIKKALFEHKIIDEPLKDEYGYHLSKCEPMLTKVVKHLIKIDEQDSFVIEPNFTVGDQ